MKARGLLAAAVLLLAGQVGTASAVTLKPSGKYAFTSTDSCEAKFTFAFGAYWIADHTTTNAVSDINSVLDGHIGSAVGYITFTPTSATGGKLTMSRTEIGGGSLRINTDGINVTTKSETFSGKYSFTANSFTLTPTGHPAMTYTMVYGELNSAGTPSSVHLVRRGTDGETNNCVETITATK